MICTCPEPLGSGPEATMRLDCPTHGEELREGLALGEHIDNLLALDLTKGDT